MISLFLYWFPFTLLFLFRCCFRFRFRFLFPFPFLFRIPVSCFSRRPIRRACSQASANMEFDRNCLQLSYALFFRLIHISLTFSERDVGTALSYSDKNHFEASISRKTYFKSSIWKYMATAPFSKTPRSCAVTLFVGFSWRHDGQDHRDKQTPKFTTVKFRFTETAGRDNW